ncbi:small conductance mechanosensitive channel [Sinobacterium caligoides]|uniref:Small-conductance mechanosensitive channel n=1 Tax=Sinobacterium caligoides TaxID=933926 RepID=A0A3N2DYW1_9GAMM|nr:mechanosensitive ion channel domain-containing protein [Sinobacterium caligoides]ROS04994.1 small conductance mechanosensitive channel [Sinobacterium caligoides]
MENIDTVALQSQAIQFGIQLVLAAVIFIVGSWIAKMITGVVRRAMEKREVEETVSKFVSNIVHAILLALVIVVMLSEVGVQTASLVAMMGAAGLAVGLALQGSLSNFASGVLLVMFRPMRVGDYVDCGGASGSVEAITMFSTQLVTPDNKIITIPNASVMSGAITNYSAKSERRVDLLVGVSYDADLAEVKKILADVVAADERVLKDHDVTIAVKELADSSVNLVMRSWVKSDDYWPTFFSMTENVKVSLDAAGISIPFPQMDLHIEKAA